MIERFYVALMNFLVLVLMTIGTFLAAYAVYLLVLLF